MIKTALLACWPLAVGLVCIVVVLAVLIEGPLSKVAGHRRLAAIFNLRLWTFDLHRDERGSVQSLSFVLTAPVFIMLMMLAVQITQLMIGEIIVNYAAFAAARSASVWIPARFEQPLELSNWLNLRQLDGSGVSTVMTTSPKMMNIHRSAAIALIPIAPSRDLGLADLNSSMTQALISTYSAYSSSAQSNKRIPMRLANKWAYVLSATNIEITTFHRNHGTPQSSYQNEPPLWNADPFGVEGYYQPNEVGWRDEITVKVTHRFALLPGPARLLAKTAANDPTIAAANRIQESSGIYYVPLSASATMVPEGEKSTAQFVHYLIGN